MSKPFKLNAFKSSVWLTRLCEANLKGQSHKSMSLPFVSHRMFAPLTFIYSCVCYYACDAPVNWHPPTNRLLSHLTSWWDELTPNVAALQYKPPTQVEAASHSVEHVALPFVRWLCGDLPRAPFLCDAISKTSSRHLLRQCD